MRSLIIFAFSIVCLSCATGKPAPDDYVVLKSTWVYCWKKCGERDSLAAVSTRACVCENGGIIPLQPTMPPEVVEETGPSRSVFDLFKE